MKSFERLGLAYLKDITGPPAVCLQSKQIRGRCSQHGTALCSATSTQTRDLCEDPVCESEDSSLAARFIAQDCGEE